MAALVDAGDTLVAQDIRRYLLEELDFWKKYGPNLPQGWWNMLFMKEPTMDSCREHYRKILHGLSVLTHGRFRELDPLVEEILELWQSLPQLEEIGKGRSTDGRLVGKSQIVQVAKQALGQQP